MHDIIVFVDRNGELNDNDSFPYTLGSKNDDLIRLELCSQGRGNLRNINSKIHVSLRNENDRTSKLLSNYQSKFQKKRFEEAVIDSASLEIKKSFAHFDKGVNHYYHEGVSMDYKNLVKSSTKVKSVKEEIL